MIFEDCRLTGIHLNYFSICKRKLYIYSKGISFESESELVKMGKAVEDMTYQNKTKNLKINNINIDFIENRMILSEIKKSDKMKDSDRMQLKYYLYYLKKYHKTIVDYGILRYPIINKTERVYLNEEDEYNIPKILAEINEIISSDICPPVIESRICKKCAYHDFCYI